MNLSKQKSHLLYVLLHIMAVLILLITPMYLVNFKTDNDTFFIWAIYLQSSVYVVLFYLNYLLLVPYLLFERKIFLYVLLVLIIGVGLYFILEQGYGHIFHRLQQIDKFREVIKIMDDDKHRPKLSPFRIHIYSHIITSFMVIGLSIGMRLAGKLIRNEKEKKELEKEKLNSELAFLKNQVSPHFFFNTLNNIYSLIEINTTDAQKAVLQLSKLMRYLLYESNNTDIQLSKEIVFMTHYIDLMKLRLSQRVKLDVKFPERYSDINLPPLLFISFIENAFKHGVSNRDLSYISITMDIINSNLIFKCINSKSPGNESIKDDDSGIGLDNVRKRLTLLFGGKHHLEIKDNETEYKVLLTIDF